MIRVILATHNLHKIQEFKTLFQNLIMRKPPFPLEPLLALRELPFPSPNEIPETGTSFSENALIKAETIFNHLPEEWQRERNTFVLADDSGLVVPILNGAPGVYSARYAVRDPQLLEMSTAKRDRLNRQKLLDELRGYRHHQRQAFFNTTLVFYGPLFMLELWRDRGFRSPFPVGHVGAVGDEKSQHHTDEIEFKVISGEVHGEITSEERGKNGFGYDSIFIPLLQGEPHAESNVWNKKTFAEMTSAEKNTFSHRAKAMENFKLYLKAPQKTTMQNI